MTIFHSGDEELGLGEVSRFTFQDNLKAEIDFTMKWFDPKLMFLLHINTLYCLYAGRQELRFCPICRTSRQVCRRIMDADRTHKTPGPEIKHSFTCTEIEITKIPYFFLYQFLKPDSHWVILRRAGDSCKCSGLSYRQGTLSLFHISIFL